MVDINDFYLDSEFVRIIEKYNILKLRDYGTNTMWMIVLFARKL